MYLQQSLLECTSFLFNEKVEVVDLNGDGNSETDTAQSNMPQSGFCPVCGRFFKDVPRHYRLAHGEFAGIDEKKTSPKWQNGQQPEKGGSDHAESASFRRAVVDQINHEGSEDQDMFPYEGQWLEIDEAEVGTEDRPVRYAVPMVKDVDAGELLRRTQEEPLTTHRFVENIMDKAEEEYRHSSRSRAHQYNPDDDEILQQWMCHVPAADDSTGEQNAGGATIDDGGVKTSPVELKAGPSECLSINNELSYFGISKTDLVMARVYKVCHDAGAPLYLCDEIMRIVRETSTAMNFDPMAATRRESFMMRNQKILNMPTAERVPVRLERGDTVFVYRFNFGDAFREHLKSEAFAQLENIVLPVGCTATTGDQWQCLPMGKPKLDEINRSHWYHRTAQMYRRELESGNYILAPIMIYVDKTGTDKLMRHSLEPVMFTSTTLCKAAREKSLNWHPLGFIPNLSTTSSAKRSTAKGRQPSRSHSVRDYHSCLMAILEPLKIFQRERPLTDFRRGNFVKRARAICPLAVVVGDNLSNSNLCGKFMNYKKSSVRMGRRCLTCYEDSDNAPHECVRVNGRQIHRLQMASLGCLYGQPHDEMAINQANRGGHRNLGHESERAAGPTNGRTTTIQPSTNLEAWEAVVRGKTKSQLATIRAFRKVRETVSTRILREIYGSHSFLSALDGVDFGANRDGEHRATVSDVMHTIEEGLIPKLLEVFYGLMPTSTREAIDGLVEDLFSRGRNRSCERDSFPKVAFTRGYTSLTLLSAGERVGQLFVLAILLNIPKGKELLDPRFCSDFDEERAKRSRHDDAPSERKRRKREAYQAGKMTNENNVRGESEGGSDSSDDEDDIENGDNSSSITGSGCSDQEDGNPKTSRLVKAIDSLRYMNLEFIEEAKEYLPADRWEHMMSLVEESVEEKVIIWKQKHVNVAQWCGAGVLDYCNSWREGEKHNESCCKTQYREVIPKIPQISREVEERDGRKPGKKRSIRGDMDEFRYLVERILAMHAAFKYGGKAMSRGKNLDRLAKRVEQLRYDIQQTVHRDEDSNGWKLEKFLEIQHFVADYKEYGVPSGYSTETGERGLKIWAKQPARTSQKRDDDIFSGQTCARIMEASILNKMDSIWKATTDEVERIEEEGKNGGLYNKLFVYRGENVVDDETVQPSEIWGLLPDGRRERKTIDNSAVFPDEIKQWFDREYGRGSSKTVYLYSELKRDGVLFRAHPDFRGQGPWFDYAMVRYDSITEEGDTVQVQCPVRIAAIFREVDSVTGSTVSDPDKEGDDGLRVLVQESEWQSPEQEENKSILFSEFTLQSIPPRNKNDPYKRAKFERRNVSELNSRIYCIEKDPVGSCFCKPAESSFDILVVKDQRAEWYKEFLKRIRKGDEI
jgi:hypothetical protein